MSVSGLQDALNALQREDIDAAITSLEHTVDALPAHPSAHVLLARAYEVRERWDDALECWANARALLPNSPVGQDGRARVLRTMDADDHRAAAPVLTLSVHDEDEAAAADPDIPSDFEALRRYAEQEARRGGARSDRSVEHDLSPGREADDLDTPEERVDELTTDASGEDDLDHLIQELESARIEPDPNAETAPDPGLENDPEGEELVSETLGRIYESQGQYREAAEVYEELAAQEPDRETEFLQKAEEMRQRADDAAPDA